MIDWKSVTWKQLTWQDWEALEDVLRIKQIAAARRRVDLKDPALIALIVQEIQDRVVYFSDVYHFARHDGYGMYAAAKCSTGLSLEDIRAEFPTPFALTRFFEDHDIFGIRVQRGSELKNASTGANSATGEPSAPSSPTSSPAPAQ